MSEEFNREKAKAVLEDILGQIDYIDVSTFKSRMRDMLRDTDLRHEDDKTDFSFLRKNDS